MRKIDMGTWHQNKRNRAIFINRDKRISFRGEQLVNIGQDFEEMIRNLLIQKCIIKDMEKKIYNNCIIPFFSNQHSH